MPSTKNKPPKHRDLLTLLDLSSAEIQKIIQRGITYKKMRRQGKLSKVLQGRSIAMIFEKPSTRTKVSFDIAIHELDGHAVHLDTSSSQLGRGETYADTARVLERFVHGVVIRTFSQKNLEELAHYASVPVINALSDESHPCQILADLMTIQETRGNKWGKVAYIGDGNNITNSWIEAALVLGFQLSVATPKGYDADAELCERARKSKNIVFTNDPEKAVHQSDVVNTDTWFSMGQEVSNVKRKLFAPFQLNKGLLRQANKEAIVLHCLPAHRGEEITDEVIDGAQSRVWDQAENRLHVQKAVLEFLMGNL